MLAKTNGGRAPTKAEFVPAYLEIGGKEHDWNYLTWDNQILASNSDHGFRIILLCKNAPTNIVLTTCFVGLANGEIHFVKTKEAIPGREHTDPGTRIARVVADSN